MRRLVALAVLALTLAVLPSGPAVADEPHPVPPSATITVVGDGSGHGKGLSQYGAYGAARQGLTVWRILDFYYPGTQLGRAGGRVAVLISADDDSDLVVGARRGLEVRDLGNGRSWRLQQRGARTWRVTPRAGGGSVMSYRTGRWHRWRVLRGDGQVSAGGAPVTLRTPDGPVRYRGALRSTRDGSRRVTVNVLPMEQYVRGVVPAEVPPSTWPQHAMRAQAVAARTYAAYERRHGGTSAYDLCDTAACQAYGGASAEHRLSDTAVARTARQVLTHQGALAFAQYSASNGGWTVDGSRPYLVGRKDPYEGTSPDFYGWTVEVSAEAVEEAYNIDHLTEIAVETRDGSGPRGGRVLTVRLRNALSGWTGTVSGDSFRRNVGLPSTLFAISSVE